MVTPPPPQQFSPQQPPGTAASAGPSSAWFWIGGAVMIAGVVGAIVWAIYHTWALDTAVSDLIRTEGRESVVFTVDEPKGLTVYDETFGDSLGRFPSGTLRNIDTGEVLTFRPYEGELDYDFGHAGTAVATVRIPAAGTYELTSGPGGSYAIGPSVAPRLAALVIGLLLIGGLGFGGGALILIIAGVRRKRARRALQYATYQPQAAPYAAGTTAWYPTQPGAPPVAAPWQPPPATWQPSPGAPPPTAPPSSLPPPPPPPAPATPPPTAEPEGSQAPPLPPS